MKNLLSIIFIFLVFFFFSTQIVKAQCTPQGDPTVFGNNVWNVYAWNAGSASDVGTSWNTNYSGYYVDTNLNLHTRWSALGSPSDVSGYSGCPVGVDNHSWSAKRTGFPSGYYMINIPSHDDEAQLFVNGANVWQHDGCCDSHANVWTGFLCSSSSVEFRVTEGGGDSYGSISFVTSNPIITSGTVLSCSISSITLSSTLTGTYLWSTGETTSSISVNTAGTYTLTATDGVCAGSNFGSVTITSLSAPTATLSGGGCVGAGNISVTNSRTPQKIEWKRNGITVQTDYASYPNAATVLGSASSAYSVCTDDADNIYVADFNNNQILKWTPGSNSPTVVAGGNGQGIAPNQLNHPTGVFVDHSGNIYISDASNYRVQKWAPGASSGTTVAGGNGIGFGYNQFLSMTGLCVDNSGNIYVADQATSRITKWLPGATTGIAVAGDHGTGNAANQLNSVYGVALDDSGNVYAIDYANSRIQKWAPGASSGITVAGGNGIGSNDNQIAYPRGLIFDKDGNMLINCYNNSYIMRWTPGASSGTYVCGYYGTSSGAVNGASGIAMTSDGTLYTCAQLGGQVLKFVPTINTTFSSPTVADYNVVATTFKGCTVTSNTFTVHSFPTVNITGNAYFCTGGSTTLSAGTHDSYLWSTGGTGQTENLNAAGNYSTTVTDFGCSSSKTFYVAEQTPVLNVSSSPSTICLGNTSQLNSTLISGGAQNLTKVYYIGVNQLFGMFNSCTGNDRYGWYYNVNAGFSFADSGIGNAVAIKLEFNVSAISDLGNLHQIRINNSTDAVGSFTAPHDYACGIDPANFVNVDLTSTNGYVVGGTNSFKINILNYFGLIRVPALNNNYARVTVQYQKLQTTYSWAPSGDTVANPIVTPAATTTYTLTATSLDCVSIPFTTTVTVAPAPGDTSVFGDNAWNVYAFNAGGATDTIHAWRNAYSGYYVDTNLNLNSQSRWNSNSSPSGASGYNGCVVNNDNHSWFAKRKGFSCGTYQIDIPGHDDAAQLWVNSVRVWEHIGCCDSHTNVWTGFLDANSTVEFKVTEGSGGSSGRINFILQNLIYKNGPSTICPGYSLQLTAGSAAGYLWSTGATTQSISVNAAGNYSVDMTTNGCTHSASQSVTVAPLDTPIIYSYSNFEFCPINGEGLSITNNARYSSVIWNTGETWTDIYLSSGGNYLVTVSDALGCSATSHASVTGPPGTDSTFGNNVWKVNAYLEGDVADYGYSWLHQDYSGYYTDTSLNFDSQNMWDQYSNPSTASNYQGCQVYDDYMSWSAKRQGFPCGVYQIDILNHNDEAQLFIDSVMVWDHDGCCDSHTNVWTGPLNVFSKVEFRVTEGYDQSNGALQFTLVDTLPVANYYADADSDGYGSSTAAPIVSCTNPGAGYVTNNTDCNDSNPDINPGATEICTNGVDDNCDGQPDILSTVITVNGPTTICPGFSVELTAPANAGSYLWNTGDTTQSIVVNSTNNYSVNMSSGVCSATSFQQITVAVLDSPVLGNNFETCPVSSNIWNQNLDSLSFTPDERVTSIQWSTGSQQSYTLLQGPGQYSVTISDALGCTATSHVTITSAAVGDPSIYGDHAWKVNNYSTGYDYTVDPFGNVIEKEGGTICSPDKYEGYYIDSTLNFNSQARWNSNSNPSTAAGYVGCNGFDGFISWEAKREGFPCGTYQIDILEHKYDADLLIDGVTVWEDATCCNSYTNAWTGFLSDTSKVAFRVSHAGGATFGALQFTLISSASSTFYADADGDGYGNANVTTQACSAPNGYVADNTDCNDGNANINPGKAEICNSIDDNCNAQIDEGVKTTFYRDADNDGYGNPNISVQGCTAPNGYVANNTDCNDTKSAIHPGATESCNNIDDNCNGQIDEGVKNTYYADLDHDGYGNPNSFVLTCSKPSGYVNNNTDCNDANMAVHPGASDVCNGIDDNCNGQIDENGITATITPTGAISFCEGGSITLTANSGTGLTYQWMKNGININGATKKTYTANAIGNYQVKETKSNGCSATSVITVVNSATSPIATITPQGNLNICQTGSVVLKANTGAGLTHQWIKGNSNISGATNSSYTATAKGTYKVIVTNSSNCSKTSTAVTVTKSCREDGSVDEIAEGTLSIYPNPATGIFVIDLNLANAENEEVTIQIYNAIGQLVQEEKTNSVDGRVKQEIHLANEATDGLYLVRVLAEDELFTKQLMIQK